MMLDISARAGDELKNNHFQTPAHLLALSDFFPLMLDSKQEDSGITLSL